MMVNNMMLQVNEKVFNYENFKNKFFDFIDVSKKTRETYLDGIENFANYIGDKEQVTRDDVIRWRNETMENLSANTVNTYLIAVKSFFSFLEEYRIYPNVTKNVKGAKLSAVPKKEVLSLEQVRHIYRNLTDLREKALFNLLISTGLRGIEIERANIEDIKEHNGEMVLWVWGKKRDDKGEYVKLADTVLEDIKNYIGDRTEGSIFISSSNHNNGSGVTTKTIRLIIKNIFKRFGLNSDNLSLHSTRRSSATLMYQAGEDIYSIQQVLHHQNISTTQRYINAITRNENNSEKLVASLIAG